MNDETVTVVDLLRHGLPEGGVRFRGSRDDPLSEEGWRQLRAAVAGHCPWDVIISSPLSRCADFARELAKRHVLPLEIEADVRELGFGEWEGRTVTEIMADTPDALSRFWRDPVHNPPPGGELLEDCAHRVTAAWNALLARHPGRHLLLICHGGIIRMLLREVLEIPLERLWRLEVPFATFSRVRVYSNGMRAEPVLTFHGKGLE